MAAPLVSVDDLASSLADPSLRVADVRWYLADPGRGRREYEAGHIPGAVFVDLDTDLSAPSGPGRHPLPDEGVFTARLGELGIGSHHRAIAYDDAGGAIAARLWWMLRHVGHESVAVLDGGFAAWERAGLPVDDAAVSHPRVELATSTRSGDVIDGATLADRLGEVVLLDARAAERYRGEIEPVDPAPGHIPTARNLPHTELLGADGRMLAPALLADRLRAAGAGTGRPVVVSCGSGVTACQLGLAMVVAGFDEPLLYPGSWSDWSSSGRPAATGPEPGLPP